MRRVVTVLGAAALLATSALAGPADAGVIKKGPVVDVPGAEAVLYEVSENMYLVDAQGNVVGPDQAVARKADAALYGWARLGSLLCPAEVLITNPRTDTCSVTAAGIDHISLATGKGTVEGTFAVVIQDDNATDSPEYVVANGVFGGQMDLSMRPLGKITGTFTQSGSNVSAPFCGTFRLPFAVNAKGKRELPRRNGAAYYLADDGKRLIPVEKAEMSLGMPTVRLEISFDRRTCGF
jgi:hypothetical protein